MGYGVGMDLGITSIGFAVLELDENEQPERIAQLGVRIFDAPEQPKTGESLAAPRRAARSARRRLRRRRHRKERIRQLIVQDGLLREEQLANLYDDTTADVYALRVQALDAPVTREYFARIMIHLAQRRGFQSNRKAEDGKEDGGAMTGAIDQNQRRMEAHGYRTVGEMLYCDELFAETKRNKTVNYQNTVTRTMVQQEAELLFARQRALGNAWASEALQAAYLDILLGQRSFDEGPGVGSPYAGNQIERMRGYCTFLEHEPRAAKATFAFERFQLISDVNKLHLVNGGKSIALTQEQRVQLIQLAFQTADLSYAKIRKALGIAPENRFNLVNYKSKDSDAEDEKKKKPNWLRAYRGIGKVLGRCCSPAEQDAIGTIFTLYKNKDAIQAQLLSYDFSPIEAEHLAEHLGNFSGFGHLSIKALQRILPHLEEGLKYDKACEAAGFRFKADGGEKARLISLSDLAKEAENTITSPVGLRALSQCAKVLNAIIRATGESPTYVKIELARELAKDFDERKKMTKSNEENQARNERIMEDIRKTDRIQTPTGQDLVKLKLYQEQGELCFYSGQKLDRQRLFEPGYVDVDHIIPYSLCFDDSYNNKVLVRTEENRQKGNRLPLQYLTGQARDAFQVNVRNSHLSERKKRNLLKEAFTEQDEDEWKERNLQDTKTISRFFYNYLLDHLELAPSMADHKKQVYAVSGAVTSHMRKRWGLSKIREDGDLHHALDAAVIACVTDGMIHKIRSFSETKETVYMRDGEHGYAVASKTGEVKAKFPQPWPGFSDALEAWLCPDPQRALRGLKESAYSEQELSAVQPVFVSRMPRRKVTGAAHKETIKSRPVQVEEREAVLKKVGLTELKLKDGEIENYYNPRSDVLLYEALKARLRTCDGDAKKAFAEPFYKPRSDGSPGPLVKKVKLTETFTVNTEVHSGAGRADNDSMVRVDVFLVPDEGYYLVPVYVADTIRPRLPNRAIVAHKSWEEWKKMKDEHFVFSIYPNDLIYVKSKKPMVFSKVRKESRLPDKKDLDGAFVYYKGANISTGAIQIITHDNTYKIEGLGAKTLVALEKYTVDLLGNYTHVSKEKRLDFKRKKKR
ncbi:MAG: type II CRISPR RNA-guided endonuclease Cas9 [Oscillospiraceae bacterium]|jgi:CRISPR-associated endonuclease Csn1|nr:type II CRISPR RNA-guided endonuclease Cas9 [Oscillospiraceae bacterium]